MFYPLVHGNTTTARHRVVIALNKLFYIKRWWCCETWQVGVIFCVMHGTIMTLTANMLSLYRLLYVLM